MIVGVTCTEQGSIIQRLPVATKLAIGLAPSGQRNYPERLDHFVFLKRGPEKSTWVKDEALFAHYAKDCRHEIAESCEKCCRVVNIMFLDDDIDSIMPHELAWWSKTGKRCWGDGVKATRKTAEKPNGQPWTPCGAECPDLKAELCAVSTDLYFVFADYPDLGSVVRLHTSSARSTQNLFSGLQQIATVTGGRLAGVTVPVCVNFEHTSYLGDDNKKHPTTVPILSFRTNLNELVANIGKTAALFSTARKAFRVGKIVVDEDEGDKSPEISSEFHPQKALPETTEQQKAGLEKAPSGVIAAAAGVGEAIRNAEGGTQPTTAPVAPKVEKSKATYEGLPKSIKPYKIGNGANKGQIFWKAVLELANGDVTLVVLSSTVAQDIEKAIASSREVQVTCEVRVQAEAHAIVAEEVAYTRKSPEPKPEPEPETEDNGNLSSFMLE
jgi:hypothetical protein